MATLQLPESERKRLEAWMREGYPQETCGLLIGRSRDGVTQVVEVVQARNLNQERARDRYLLDPDDYLKADESARARGLSIVGIWHSHPDHPARPSATDRAHAWEGWSYLIASVSREGVTDLRSWRLRSGAFEEEEVAA
ncbi:Mov34/MPN/PAD-1 family protein [Pelomicrobium methylotrophicum]|uniref:M67 family metallopeptidase n=1 Tax=Pelomicrobium methylotrophicum TaxID=2602750 RepID=A0A5C7EW39_9PROT|nr:M67 family metallopeptidase [Pelomicrobium methylotrophicum]TXF12392.1 M67 family metallopeptidase [Pelomicrobium methylotrophicum]